MYPSSPSRRGEGGFTLIETMVAMVLLVVVVTLSLTFVFAMQNFSTRQQLFVEPRQTARRGVDYLSYFLRNAGARVVRNNSGIVAWSNSGDATHNTVAGLVQVSYNNVTSAQSTYADLGTDVISMVLPAGDFSIPVQKYPGNQGVGGAASVMFINFSKGCGASNDDAANIAAFQSECECTYGSYVNVYDDKGTVITAQINPPNPGGQNNGISSMCNSNPPQIKIAFNSGLSNYNPPGAYPELDCPVCTLGSMQFASFRVKNHQLQENSVLFNPASPDAGFVPLLDGVEDMQIAYIFDDGTIWNDISSNDLPAPTAAMGYDMTKFSGTPTGGVPLPPLTQGASGDNAHGVTHLRGLRLSIVARSSTPMPLTTRNRYFKPAVEDGAQGTLDSYYHYRLTGTIMIRNQMLGE